MTGFVHRDVVVIGGGPAGHKAAIQAAKAGRSVVLIEREASAGGACVRQGTIPSKALRETALAVDGLRRRSGGVFSVEVREDLLISSLMTRLDDVVGAHERFLSGQLSRNGIEFWRGRARFIGPRDVEVLGLGGERRRVRGDLVVIATGSRPRNPKEIAVDHEHVLDSDSILSLTWIPRSLVVLGGGVIACEYASIFAALGTKVTVVDSGPRPLGFVDPEITERFTASLVAMGGAFVGGRRARSAVWDGASTVVTTLDDGETLRSERVLFALGRVACLEGLDVAAAGIVPDARGLVPVDANYRTAAEGVYAVGDVIGPPSLASTSMEQGRRAVCHALGLDPGPSIDTIPVGIYAIPEMASVGISEAQAIERHGSAVVGRAPFSEIARGHISGNPDGLLKMVADPCGHRLLGVQVVGEGAAELVHIGQMALCAGLPIEFFVETIFNFPTLAEAYRVAALDVVKRRRVAAAAAA